MKQALIILFIGTMVFAYGDYLCQTKQDEFNAKVTKQLDIIQSRDSLIVALAVENKDIKESREILIEELHQFIKRK